MMVPLPDDLTLFRPYWVAMILIYWCLEAPDRVGTVTAFFAGIGVDLVYGNLLGQHALGLCVVAYIIQRSRLKIRFYPLWQQATVVLAVLLNDRVVNLWVYYLTGSGIPAWGYWVPPLAALAFWPWLYLLLDRADQFFRRRA